MQYNNLEGWLQKIRRGEIAWGCCITLSDPAVTEIAAESGFDFCWIDGEHGCLDRQTAMNHIMALKGTACAPFYRVPDSSHTEIKKIIDFAPAAIIAPMVMNAEDATRVVQACRYPPLGERGFGPRRGHRYSVTPLADYLALSNGDPLVILQIEHIEAVRQLEAILHVPGVDGILIGPSDLSFSLGKPQQWGDPELESVLDRICQKTRAADKILGVYAESDFARWQERGVNFISVVGDAMAMARRFADILRRARQETKSI